MRKLGIYVSMVCALVLGAACNDVGDSGAEDSTGVLTAPLADRPAYTDTGWEGWIQTDDFEDALFVGIHKGPDGFRPYAYVGDTFCEAVPFSGRLPVLLMGCAGSSDDLRSVAVASCKPKDGDAECSITIRRGESRNDTATTTMKSSTNVPGWTTKEPYPEDEIGKCSIYYGGPICGRGCCATGERCGDGKCRSPNG